MVVACSYKILWPKIDFWHILACFGPFLHSKNAQNWNGLPGHVYGSINLKKKFGGSQDLFATTLRRARLKSKFFFFWPRLIDRFRSFIAVRYLLEFTLDKRLEKILALVFSGSFFFSYYSHWALWEFCCKVSRSVKVSGLKISFQLFLPHSHQKQQQSLCHQRHCTVK